jgi:hypothetical protein
MVENHISGQRAKIFIAAFFEIILVQRGQTAQGGIY